MIVLLLSAFAMVFFGMPGGGVDFLTVRLEAMEDGVKEVVTDEARRDEILALLEERKAKRDEIRQELERNRTDLLRVDMNYSSSAADYEKLSEALHERFGTEFKEALALRGQTQQLFVGDEWPRVLAASEEKTAAEIEKAEQAWDKARDEIMGRYQDQP